MRQGRRLFERPAASVNKEMSREILILRLRGRPRRRVSVERRHVPPTSPAPGATFPFPVYAKWAEAYKKETDIGLNYQSIGSSGGIRQIRAKTVDFGATDAPLKGEELEKDGFVQFPTVMGGVVAVYNIPGVETGKLKLTGDVLADIFNGKITKWNDAKIAADQRGRDAARRQHHPGLPLGRIGHDQRLHHLSVAGFRELEERARRRRIGAVAGRPGRQGQ